MAFPLELCAAVYGGISGLRNRLFDRGVLRVYRSTIPVISVGNVTAGGTGKTPLVLHLVELLMGHGLKPAVLSRGYGGTERGPRRLDPSDDPSIVGDEPLLLARRTAADVWIARNRAAGAKAIELSGNCDIIILDDGLQHRWLARDLDLLVLDTSSEAAVDRITSGQLLPLGRLRERVADALLRAQAIVLSFRSLPAPARPRMMARIVPLLPAGVPLFSTQISSPTLIDLHSHVLVGRDRCFLVSAIGNPAAFVETVQSMGIAITGEQHFPDHHTFAAADVRGILERAAGAPLVCTEKDAVKLERLLPADVPCAFVRIEIDVEPAGPFEACILSAIART